MSSCGQRSPTSKEEPGEVVSIYFGSRTGGLEQPKKTEVAAIAIGQSDREGGKVRGICLLTPSGEKHETASWNDAGTFPFSADGHVKVQSLGVGPLDNKFLRPAARHIRRTEGLCIEGGAQLGIVEGESRPRRLARAGLAGVAYLPLPGLLFS